MGKPLRVLLVEDSADDAEIILHALKQGGYEPVYERIDTAGAMMSALGRGSWDVVLSDYTMPLFSGLKALNLLQAKGQDVPFILVSGAIGEEIAVAMMKAGASDYVMKGNLKRLVAAVQRELKDAAVRRERRQAEEALQESERRLKVAQALGRIGDWEFDLATQKIEWSDETYRLYEREKTAGPPAAEEEASYYTPEEAARLREFSRRAIENGEDFRYDLTAKLPGGKTIFLNATMHSIKDDNGRVIKLFGTVQDITVRKHAEDLLKASEAKFRNLVENAPVGIGITTLDGRALVRNTANARMLGYDSVEELLAMPVTNRYYHPEERKRFVELARKGIVRDFEVLLKRKDGSPHWVSLTAIPQNTGDGEQLILTVIQDINERKQTEEALTLRAKILDAVNESIVVREFTGETPGRIIYTNRSTQKILGYATEEFIKLKLGEYHTIESAVQIQAHLSELIEKGTVSFETIYRRKDGSAVDVEVHSDIVILNEIRYVVSIMRDITVRKQAVEALKVSEAKFRTLVDNLPLSVAIADPRGYALERNRVGLSLFGYDSQEESRLANAETTYPDLKDREQVLDLFARGQVKDFEVRRKRKDGSVFWASMTVVPYPDDTTGKRISVIQDITERKKTQEELLLKANLLDAATDAILVRSFDDGPKAKILYVNQAACQMFGYTVEEFLNLTMRDISTNSSPALTETRRRHLEETGENYMEVSFRGKDGKMIPTENHSKLITIGGIRYALSVVRDITQRKKSQVEIELKATLLDAAGDMIYVQDRDGRIIYANDATCKTHGYTREEMLQRTIRDLLSPERAKNVVARNSETFEKGEVRFETEHVCRDGKTIVVEVYNRLVKLDGSIAIISVGRDVTERKKELQQLMVTSRLVSIGELASGVAHEINNPLTSVIGFTSLLLEQPLPDDIKEDLGVVLSEAERAARVVRNLLTFARKHDISRTPVAVNNIIEKVLELRGYEHKASNITVVKDLAMGLPDVNGDFYQLQQVFFNLFVNAEYFMLEAHKSGTLTITTCEDNGIIRATVADDGPGISEENQKHVFSPFFTTKPVGKGTGLGLSVCHGIIAEHQGTIRLESTWGKGSIFIVEIPVADY
jgi:PAS domain S-box-containing protein